MCQKNQIKGGRLYNAKFLTYKVYSKRLVHFDYPFLLLLPDCPAAIEKLAVFVGLTFPLVCAAFPSCDLSVERLIYLEVDNEYGMTPVVYIVCN